MSEGGVEGADEDDQPVSVRFRVRVRVRVRVLGLGLGTFFLLRHWRHDTGPLP
jgi:hypothetical protein